jgi:hypothetical protein
MVRCGVVQCNLCLSLCVCMCACVNVCVEMRSIFHLINPLNPHHPSLHTTIYPESSRNATKRAKSPLALSARNNTHTHTRPFLPPELTSHLSPPPTAQRSFLPPSQPASQSASQQAHPRHAMQPTYHLPSPAACLPAVPPHKHTHPHLRRSPHPACAPLQLGLPRPGTQGGAAACFANHALPTTLVAGGATCMCMPAAWLPEGDHRATGTGGWDCLTYLPMQWVFLG